MMQNRYAFLVLLMFQAVLAMLRNDPVAKTKTSLIKGLWADDGDYANFLGIPFAQVDENNPFGSSIPYTLNGVFEAYNGSIMCPQVNPNNDTIISSIDCLRLNIYVPASANLTDTLLPVMIWIHGGSFLNGYAFMYGPTYLVKHNVIIVTINYRVGPYGFMCLDIPEISGNQGLKDQYHGIKWIKDNIDAFGGDPNEITLFGESAGGHSVDFHMMSDKERLFDKIILQSGSAQALTVLYEPDKLSPIKLASYIGLKTENMKEALSYLAKTDTNLVVTAAIDLNLQFKPCVETVFNNVESFIVNNWIDAPVSKVKNIPVLMGFTKHEMAALFNNDAEYFNNLTIVSDSLERVFELDEKVNETIDFVSNYYFGGQVVSEYMKWDVIRFTSDFTYIHPIHRTLNKYLENGAGDIYFYMFTYVGGRNTILTTTYDEYESNGNNCCSAHADDLYYLFNMSNKPLFTDADEVISERLTKMWTNFAKHSNPTPAIDDLLPVFWEPFTKENPNYLDIGTELQLGKRPLRDRMAFWDLFYTHNKLSHKWS